MAGHGRDFCQSMWNRHTKNMRYSFTTHFEAETTTTAVYLPYGGLTD